LAFWIEGGVTKFFIETLLRETREIDLKHQPGRVVKRSLQSRLEGISLLREDVNGSEKIDPIVISLNSPKSGFGIAKVAGRRARPQEKTTEQTKCAPHPIVNQRVDS